MYPERPWMKPLIFAMQADSGWKRLVEDPGPFRRHIFLEAQHRKCPGKSSVFMFFHELCYRRENTRASKFRRRRRPTVAGRSDGYGNGTAYTRLCVDSYSVSRTIFISRKLRRKVQVRLLLRRFQRNLRVEILGGSLSMVRALCTKAWLRSLPHNLTILHSMGYRDMGR